jgi:hypothetical protein
MQYASRLQHYLTLKNEIFISTDRAFHKNAQIFTTVRLALTLLLELICFKIIAERFALLTFLAEKRRILGRKNGTPRAKIPRA